MDHRIARECSNEQHGDVVLYSFSWVAGKKTHFSFFLFFIHFFYDIKEMLRTSWIRKENINSGECCFSLGNEHEG